MNSLDTICALATSLGESAINIIRISGKDAIDIASSILQGVNLNKKEGGTISYAHVVDNGEYLVGIYANARKNTHIQGFDFEEGANDMVYIAANDVRVYIPAYTEDYLINGNGVCGIRTKVTNGTLRISMVAEKTGTNWHTIQIK